MFLNKARRIPMPDAPREPTDAERWHAYSECRKASIDAGNKLGLNFIVDVFKLDIPAAVRDWFLMASKDGIKDNNSCYAFLTPEQRKQAIEEIYGEWGTYREGKYGPHEPH
jgi:hypothetical protein